MVVSAIAALNGNSSLALGNAYGSNIFNIGLILGVTAILSPIAVRSNIVHKELPILVAITLFSGWLIFDGVISGYDALALLVVFAGLMSWSIYAGLRSKRDALATEFTEDLAEQSPMSLKLSLFWVSAGLLLLILSSRLLVWGAVNIAQSLGVSDLIIGLTIVAAGTSLPELATSIISVRKNEHDIALGNILGSNLFNTLAVVGIAAAIQPITVEAIVLHRDWLVMLGMTVALFIMAFGFKQRGYLTRVEGSLLLVGFLAYNAWLLSSL
jgi:cation:H+ antiporter